MKKGKVDIVCGGQFGDEGKGAIAAWLMNKYSYDFTVRVGGCNAEHRFYHHDRLVTNRVLPCGWINPDSKIYLGAGHLFSIEALRKELADTGAKNVFIDYNAGIVTPAHQEQSRVADRTKRGGTTGQGVGKAAAHKVLRDGTFGTAENCPELFSLYPDVRVADTVMMMREDLKEGLSGLLEGSQGALLSLNHGYYPYNCAKDVTPAGILAETGLNTGDVHDIVAVYRSYPTRVPGKSGPSLGAELAWGDVERRIGKFTFVLLIPDAVKKQTLPDGSKGEYERVFEWSWQEFERSLSLCGPTAMAFTFADWRHPSNLVVSNWWNLDRTTQAFVEIMENRARMVLQREVPVILIKTGPRAEDIVVSGQGTQ